MAISLPVSSQASIISIVTATSVRAEKSDRGQPAPPPGRPGGGAGCQVAVQVKADSAEFEPLTVMPNVVDPPADIEPLYEALLALTLVPVCLTVAFHELEMTSAASASMKPAVQPVTETLPVSVTVS